METSLNIVSIVIIVFGILQIILFFKLWGMTNDIREMKSKYMEENYNRIVEEFREIKDKYIKDTNKVSTHKDSSTPKENKTFSNSKNELSIKKEIQNSNTINVNADRQLEEIDIENEDFNKLISRWKVLKNRGFIKQAIDEYIEKTSLPIEDAEKFIEEL